MDDKKEFEDINITPVDSELDEELKKKQELLESEDVIELKTTSRRDERFVAFNLIYAADRFDYVVELDEIIENFTHGYGLNLSKGSFALKLAMGVIEKREALDEQITPYLKNWKMGRLGVCTRLILRMALWEMQQPGAIGSIIINEAVELAKIFAEKDAYKFINGILDEICKSTAAAQISDSEKMDGDGV